jgi:OmcA/MtrC family decaheme c-type cytochrome
MIKRSLTVLALAGVIAIPAGVALSGSDSPTTSRRRPVTVQPAAPATPAATDYAVTRTEHYLGDEGVAYIRPGLKVKINSITNVAAGQKPVIDFNLMDDYDQPLDRLGLVTPGAVSTLGFILSRWDDADRNYYTYTTRTRSGVTNPSGDSGGKYTDLDIGHYIYEFGTVMPEDLDPATTLTLGVYARRRITEPIQKDYYADNVFIDFRPDGMMPSSGWNAMPDVDATCNRCHDVLAEHGGTRRTPQMCAMCHNNQIAPDSETGESFNSKVLFHKVHRGESLPSVEAGHPYVAGGTDFSEVVFPQDIRNCETCHDQEGGEPDIWWNRPTRQACGSCHDDIDWVTGENHGGGLQVDDVSCINCHYEDGDDFGPSVKGAHIVPTESRQLKGLEAEIVSVSNTAPGENPTAVFKITEADGTAVDGTTLGSSFAPILAGPTTSYTTYWRENGSTGTFDAAAGTTSYTFTNAIPEGATGSWVVSGDLRRAVSLKPGDGGPNFNVNEGAINPIKYIAVTDDTPTPRRRSVTIEQCNSCHERLAMHGGQRFVVEECVICHNPTNTDVAVRTAGIPESISFQRMIHRIHTGHDLTNEYTIYGFRSSVHNYNELRFPGDRRNCQKCHTSSGYLLPIAKGADTVHVPSEYMTEQGPGTAACLGCHDSQDAMAHAYQQTAYFPGSDKPSESCGTCHGGNSDWSVDRVHAR